MTRQNKSVQSDERNREKFQRIYSHCEYAKCSNWTSFCNGMFGDFCSDECWNSHRTTSPEWVEAERINQLKLKFSSHSDTELESAWQSTSSMISTALMKSYSSETSKEESQRLFELAQNKQEEQGIIQKEITLRSKN